MLVRKIDLFVEIFRQLWRNSEVENGLQKYSSGTESIDPLKVMLHETTFNNNSVNEATRGLIGLHLIYIASCCCRKYFRV